MKKAVSRYRSAFVEIEVQRATGVVVYRRTAVPFTQAREIDGLRRELRRVLPAGRRKGRAILLDMRLAPTRVDLDLERDFARLRYETERGFERGCVLVRTTPGRVRSERLAKESAIPLRVVDSEEDAWRAVRGECSAGSAAATARW